MNENDFKKGIDDLKKIKLSPEEKRALYSRITGSQIKIKSPWYFSSVSYFSYAGALALILIFIGTNAFNKAEKSLPGDGLYSLKVDVLEPLKLSLATTPIAKANIEAQNLNTRLMEAETLEVQGKLSTSSKVELENKVKEHADSFINLVETSDKTGSSTEEAIKTVQNFQKNIAKHSDILDKLTSKKEKKRNETFKTMAAPLNFSSTTINNESSTTEDKNIDKSVNENDSSSDEKLYDRTKALLNFLESRRNRGNNGGEQEKD